jgi:tRNA threonylcarbamoyl adenosine modification protein YeaZ
VFILSFETISEYISVSLLEDGILIDSLVCFKNFAHAETILTSIELILVRNSIDYSDIDLFSLIVGPSSFIKIRVGLSVAYGLEFSSGKKVIGINLFEIYENIVNINYNIERFIIVLNAYQDNFYIRVVDGENSEDSFVNLDYIKNSPFKGASFFCDSKSYNILKDISVNDVFDISKYIDNLSAQSGIFVRKKIVDGLINLDDIMKPEPFYLFNPVFKKKVAA